MSISDSDNRLLREQLGKGTVEVINASSGAQTSKDYYAVYFPVNSTVSAISIDGTAEAKLAISVPGGTTYFCRTTAITLSAGVAMCYTEHDNDTSN